MTGLSGVILSEIIQFLTSVLPAFKIIALVIAFCLIQIDLVLTFVNGEADIFKILPIKLLISGFFLSMIFEYNWVLENMINGAIQLGNYGVMNSTSTDLLISPFRFLGDLIAVLTPLLGITSAGAIALDFAGIESVPTMLMFFIAGLVGLAILMSLEIILVVIEYYFIGICAILLLPFGCFDKTRSFAVRGISALFAQSFKILIFTLLINFIEKQWNAMILNGIKLDFISLSQNLVILALFYFLINRVSAITNALLGGTAVSSGGSSAMLASFTWGAFGNAGSILKSEFSKAGGFSGMMSKFTGGNSNDIKALESYKNATGSGGGK